MSLPAATTAERADGETQQMVSAQTEKGEEEVERWRTRHAEKVGTRA